MMNKAHRMSLTGLGLTLSTMVVCGIFNMMPEAHAQSWVKQLDGVEYATIDRVHAVRIDLDLVGVSIFPKVSAKGEPATPKSWAQKHGLEVAINANFYSTTDYSPCSFAICNGTDWGSGWNPSTYAQIGFTKDNRLKWLEQSSEASQQSWMYNVVSGTPEIVVNGAVVPNLHSSKACVDLTHCGNIRARSGIGIDKDQKYLYLVTSKGDGSSSGNTVKDFAATMVKLGIWYGINLDGGGSAGLYVNGTTYGTNVSSRSVSVNLGFDVKAKPEYVCKSAEVDNPSSTFYDIPAGHWGLEAAKALADRGVTLGCGNSAYGNPLFCPECGTQRVQAAVFLARALKLTDTPPSTPSFQDVTTKTVSTEQYAAVEALLKHGIVSPGATFRPFDILSRAETATMISKAYIPNTIDYKNAPTPTFTDVSKSDWEYPYVEAAARHCYMSGTGNNLFSPDEPTSRIQFATALARAAKWINTTCAFTKECDTNGEKSCSGSDIMTCTAYELVKEGTCPNDSTCKNGTCVTNAVCNDSDPTICVGNFVKSCVNGQWSTTTCTHACENGKCVECTSDTVPTCQGDTIARCIDGKLEYSTCGANESCKDAQCQSNNTCHVNELQCIGNHVYVCTDGKSLFMLENCETTSKLCQDGVCVEPKPECTDDFTAVCASDTSMKLCSEGKFVTVDCNDDEKCQNGQCVSHGNNNDNTGGDNENSGGDNENSGGDNENSGGDNENSGSDNENSGSDNENSGNDNENTENNGENLVFSESSCSHSNRSGHPMPWVLAILGCLSGLILRRTRKEV